jgi:hypothetical protein
VRYFRTFTDGDRQREPSRVSGNAGKIALLL